MVICKKCLKEKKHKAKGLCDTCYQKSLNKYNICECCKVLKIIYRRNPDYCFKCFQLNGEKTICSKCNNFRIIYNKKQNLCKKCYRPPNKSSIHIKKCVCVSCKILKNICTKNLCRKCYYAARNKKTNCNFCNKIKSINKWINNKAICKNCDITINHTSNCSICKKLKPLFFNNNTICRACYLPPKRKCDVCNKINIISLIKENKKICVKCYNKLPERKTKNIRGDTKNLIKTDWIKIMSSTNWKCFYCDTKLNEFNRTIDHIIPIKNGGTNSLSNLIPSCRKCNSSKNDRDVFKWAEFENIKFSKQQIERLLEVYNGHKPQGI